MADEAEDVLELDAEMEAPEDDEQTDGTAPENEDDGESLIPTFGEESEAAPASESESSTIREMRSQLRQAQRELAEARKGHAPQKIEVGERPTLESCDYDEDRYNEQLDAWRDRKGQADKQQAEMDRAAEVEAKVWGERHTAYAAAKAKLPTDFAAAEQEVQTGLPIPHQNILLMSERSAALVYALGKDPAKLDALSKLDPIRAAMMIGKLEDKITMAKRTVPQPERQVSGNARLSDTADKQLAQLEKEADRTGDRTKLIAYRKKLKDQAA